MKWTTAIVWLCFVVGALGANYGTTRTARHDQAGKDWHDQDSSDELDYLDYLHYNDGDDNSQLRPCARGKHVTEDGAWPCVKPMKPCPPGQPFSLDGTPCVPEDRRPSSKPTPRTHKPSQEPSQRTRKPSSKPTPRTRKPSSKPTPRTRKPSSKPTPRTRKPSPKPTPRTRKPSPKPTPRTRKPTALSTPPTPALDTTVYVKARTEVIAKQTHEGTEYYTYRLVVDMDPSYVRNVYAMYGDQEAPAFFPAAWQLHHPLLGQDVASAEWFGDVWLKMKDWLPGNGHAALQADVASPPDSWLSLSGQQPQVKHIGIPFETWTSSAPLKFDDGAVFWMDPRTGPGGHQSVVCAQITLPRGDKWRASANFQGKRTGSGTKDWQQKHVEWSSDDCSTNLAPTTAPTTIPPSTLPPSTMQPTSKQPTTRHPIASPVTSNPTADSSTASPTRQPSARPTTLPTRQPTDSPTTASTAQPTAATSAPTKQPTPETSNPTAQPTAATSAPTGQPTAQPSASPTTLPTRQPTVAATSSPTGCASAPASFTQVSTGTCASQGLVAVVDPAECSSAVSTVFGVSSPFLTLYGEPGCAIGSDGNSYGFCNGGSNSKPTGCSFRNGAYYSHTGSSEEDCGGRYACICKNGCAGSATASPTTAFTAQPTAATSAPTRQPTPETSNPTAQPTAATSAPTGQPTAQPTATPTSTTLSPTLFGGSLGGGIGGGTGVGGGGVGSGLGGGLDGSKTVFGISGDAPTTETVPLLQGSSSMGEDAPSEWESKLIGSKRYTCGYYATNAQWCNDQSDDGESACTACAECSSSTKCVVSPSFTAPSSTDAAAPATEWTSQAYNGKRYTCAFYSKQPKYCSDTSDQGETACDACGECAGSEECESSSSSDAWQSELIGKVRYTCPDYVKFPAYCDDVSDEGTTACEGCPSQCSDSSKCSPSSSSGDTWVSKPYGASGKTYTCDFYAAYPQFCQDESLAGIEACTVCEQCTDSVQCS